MISTYDGDQISPEQSWHYFNCVLEYQSIGVVAVSVGECDTHLVPVLPDPKTLQEHVLINFRTFSTRRIKDLAKTLTGYARSRGWQYRPTP